MLMDFSLAFSGSSMFVMILLYVSAVDVIGRDLELLYGWLRSELITWTLLTFSIGSCDLKDFMIEKGACSTMTLCFGIRVGATVDEGSGELLKRLDLLPSSWISPLSGSFLCTMNLVGSFNGNKSLI